MPTPQSQADASRFDPYGSFRFRVQCGGVYVAGVSEVGGLSRAGTVTKHPTGGDPGTVRLSPGISEYAAITLERGVTHDASFLQWANKIWDYTNSSRGEDASNQIVSLKDFRRDIVIELYNEAGQKVLAYNVYRCWVSEFHALPDLNAQGTSVAIQSLKLENEGWERDPGVTAPGEPAFVPPAS
ncbi:MAG: phage tail protein [Gluconacetobacter diazotrophicus]|nr:phage tail protein [Gluconacetobacter diazotrophicus]